MKISKNKVLLELENPIAFYPKISRKLGGIGEAVFAQQLYYWQSRGKRKDGFIYKTKDEWEEETTLSIRQQDRIRKKFENFGLIETKLIKANGSPTIHYKLNVGIFQDILNGKIDLDYDKMSYSNMTKSKIPVTENTTEIKIPKGILANAKKDQTPSPLQVQGSGDGVPSSEVTIDGGLDKNEDLLSKQIQEIMAMFYEINPTLNFANKTSRLATEWMIKKWGIDQVRSMTTKVIECQGNEFAPVATNPWEMKEKLLKFKMYFERDNKPKAQMYER